MDTQRLKIAIEVVSRKESYEINVKIGERDESVFSTSPPSDNVRSMIDAMTEFLATEVWRFILLGPRSEHTNNET